MSVSPYTWRCAANARLISSFSNTTTAQIPNGMVSTQQNEHGRLAAMAPARLRFQLFSCRICNAP